MDDTAQRIRNETQKVFVQCSEECGPTTWGFGLDGVGQTSVEWAPQGLISWQVYQLTSPTPEQ